MDLTFFIIAVLTLGSAIAAMSLRNLVHCALCMVVTFAGIALTYLKLNAEFVGFAQLLVYVGAVAILIVFAVLLTRGDENKAVRFNAGSVIGSLAVVAVVAVALIGAINKTKILPSTPVAVPQMTVKQIGDQLMTRYVLPLEVIGLLLTATMIGAVVISIRDQDSDDKTSLELPGRGKKPVSLETDSMRKSTLVVSNE